MSHTDIQPLHTSVQGISTAGLLVKRKQSDDMTCKLNMCQEMSELYWPGSGCSLLHDFQASDSQLPPSRAQGDRYLLMETVKPRPSETSVKLASHFKESRATKHGFVLLTESYLGDTLISLYLEGPFTVSGS